MVPGVRVDAVPPVRARRVREGVDVVAGRGWEHRAVVAARRRRVAPHGDDMKGGAVNNTHEFAVGLRDLADWIEAHPEHIGKYTKLTLNVPVDTREELAAAARALGGERKKALDSFYYGVDQIGRAHV